MAARASAAPKSSSTARQVGSSHAPAQGRGAPALVPGAAGREARALDPVIHERTRLGILSALAVSDTLSFVELKTLLQASDGNLSVHARKLEEANYIVCTKSFAGRMPRTEYRLSPMGRRALERYLDHMEALIYSTRDR